VDSPSRKIPWPYDGYLSSAQSIYGRGRAREGDGGREWVAEKRVVDAKSDGCGFPFVATLVTDSDTIRHRWDRRTTKATNSKVEVYRTREPCASVWLHI
jgi:hypothetical protein